MISPRTLKGFRDYLPEMMNPREGLIDTARRVYRSYGFSPIDTPALEYLEILLGKGGEETDKQLYRFEDHGGRSVGLRFDLTVPLARFAAQHMSVLGTPFKRYQIAPVWRGENTQRGRYREFLQCDFDTVGTRSTVADIEAIVVIHDLMRAIGFEQFTIRVNHRKVLGGVLEKLDLAERSHDILRSLDKLAKVGSARVAQELVTSVNLTETQAQHVLELAELKGTNDQIVSGLEVLVQGSPIGEEGTSALAELLGATKSAGVDESCVQLDPSIARGLDYYTGTIFETFLDALPGIGSVCSGGRYDDLAGLYTSQELPGVGGSLGLDRLLTAMEELDMIEKVQTPAPVLVTYFQPDRLHDYLRLASQIRAAGVGVEVYPEARKLGQQLKYADRRGFRVALIAGQDEFEAGTCQIKDLASGARTDVSIADGPQELVTHLRRLLEED